MVYSVANTAGEQWLRGQGYQGDFGAGGAQAWLNQNPNIKTAYNSTFTGNSAWNPATGGGAMPITNVPLHDWEKKGLTQMAEPPAYGGGSMTMANQMLQEMAKDPRAFAAKYTNPMATDYMTRAGTATSGAMNPITMEEINATQNPYASAMKSRLTSEGEKIRAAILAGQGMRGGRSFGDTSQGVRQGMLYKELVQGAADIDYKTFETALSELNKMRDRSMQAGGQFGNLAQGAQGITNSAAGLGAGGLSFLFGAGERLTDIGRQTAQDKRDAGQYVRNYNQNTANQIGSDILASQQYPSQQMSQILNWLKSFESNTGPSTSGANALETAGGIAGILGQWLKPTKTGA